MSSCVRLRKFPFPIVSAYLRCAPNTCCNFTPRHASSARVWASIKDRSFADCLLHPQFTLLRWLHRVIICGVAHATVMF